MGKTKPCSLDGKRTKKSKGVIIIQARRVVTLERKTGIVTADGPAGGSWDAGNVLFGAWMVGIGMLFYNNSLSPIYIYVMQLLSVFCLIELCGIANIQPFF